MQQERFGCKIVSVDNEKLLEEFFRTLKVSFTNASSYSKDHPYFIKSVENFKTKLEDTLAVLNPLHIGVTGSAVVVNGKELTKTGFYGELASQLHQRKIKSVEIRSGATQEELIQFLSAISLPQKDIFKAGGISAILKIGQFPHFTIGELDYSAFLQGQAHECSDLWGYLLKEAAYSGDTAKLERIADDFGPLLKQSSEKDICSNQEVASDIKEFLLCLKNRNREKFDRCSKDIFLWLLHHKKSFKEGELEKFKPVFKSLDQEDFSNLLWEGILGDNNFDDLSLQLFSKISEQKDEHKIAEELLGGVNQQSRLKDNPNALKRVQRLLSSSEGDKLSPVYRNILESLVKETAPSGVLLFDQNSLRQNYRYIVFNLLSAGENEPDRRLASEVLAKELAGILGDNDFSFLKDLYSFLLQNKDGIEAYLELEKKLSVFIEHIVLNQPLPAGSEFLLGMVSTTAYDANYYLDKIFTSTNTNKQVLALFFRLFGQQLDGFYQRLEQKSRDMDFLDSLIESLSQLEPVAALPVLEYTYTSANELMKCEVLKAMRKFKTVDVNFLIRQLNTDSFPLKKNLLSVLTCDVQGLEEALDLLLRIPSPWGRKNQLLIENMQIVADLKITASAGRLRDLAGRKFFWNSRLRTKARQVLGEFNER